MITKGMNYQNAVCSVHKRGNCLRVNGTGLDLCKLLQCAFDSREENLQCSIYTY